MKKIFTDFIKPIIICVCLVGLFLIFFRPAIVDGSSMVPTLADKDILILKRNLHDLGHGDIVAIRSARLNKILCKRVIGVPNDHIVINRTGMYRNGELLVEDYINESVWTFATTDVEVTVPEGKVFVLGDNRNNSSDSRTLGCLDQNDILGIMTSDVTKVFHINSSEYKIILYILWLAFIMYYISTLIIRCIRKRKVTEKNNSKVNKQDG